MNEFQRKFKDFGNVDNIFFQEIEFKVQGLELVESKGAASKAWTRKLTDEHDKLVAEMCETAQDWASMASPTRKTQSLVPDISVKGDIILRKILVVVETAMAAGGDPEETASILRTLAYQARDEITPVDYVKEAPVWRPEFEPESEPETDGAANDELDAVPAIPWSPIPHWKSLPRAGDKGEDKDHQAEADEEGTQPLDRYKDTLEGATEPADLGSLIEAHHKAKTATHGEEEDGESRDVEMASDTEMAIDVVEGSTISSEEEAATVDKEKDDAAAFHNALF